MRYEAAWNLVGIPDDAKDAAQIAARKAGMSVGEWLTKNVLSSLEDIKIPAEGRPRANLSGQLAELSHRLREFEEESDSEPLREAVKKLHDGLSRLAAEFVQTTGQSAIQVSTLASNLEAVAKRIEEARAEYTGSSEAVEFRLTQIIDEVTAQKSTLGADVQRLAVKLDDARADTSAKLLSEAGQQMWPLLVSLSGFQESSMSFREVLQNRRLDLQNSWQNLLNARRARPQPSPTRSNARLAGWTIRGLKSRSLAARLRTAFRSSLKSLRFKKQVSQLGLRPSLVRSRLFALTPRAPFPASSSVWACLSNNLLVRFLSSPANSMR